MNRPGTRVVWCVVVLVLSTACSVPPLAAPERPSSPPVPLPTGNSAGHVPAGTVTVAYPSEPSAFLAPDRHDLAGDDLQALWGLPLLRLDGAGQARRGLVEDWTVVGPTDHGWQVNLSLRAGTWTDGSSVVAADAVATLQAARERDPARFGVVSGAAVVDEGTVAVRFAAPHTAWADLLAEVGTVLPASVWSEGVDEYDDAVPVSGGWFEVTGYEPGLRVTLRAHGDGPLGSPGVERIEVLFTPQFETARGLLADGDVDVLLGYLALNGVARSTELEGVDASSPLGGTTVSLEFRAGGTLGGAEMAAQRRGVAETVDVGELVEGMLGPNGAPASSPWPGVAAPGDAPAGEVRAGQQFSLLYPGDSEVLGFAARAIQRDLTSRGMTVDLVAESAPRHAEVLDEERDVALVVRRTSGRPPLGPYLDDVDVARAADVAATSSPAAEEGLRAVAASARVAPLFRVGVLHAWKGVDEVRPSSWRGAGFWNAGEWRTTTR